MDILYTIYHINPSGDPLEVAYILGQPNFFWDFRLHLHGEVWAKTCLETNFQPIRKLFDHVTEALMVPRMSQNEPYLGTFGGSVTWSNDF